MKKKHMVLHAYTPFHGWIYMKANCTTYTHAFWGVYSLSLHWYKDRLSTLSAWRTMQKLVTIHSFYAVVYILNYLPSFLSPTPTPNSSFVGNTCGPWSGLFLAEASVFLCIFLMLVWGRGFKCCNGCWPFVVVGRTSSLSVLLFVIVAWSLRQK